MERFILGKSQAHDLVWQNRYPVTPKTKFLSRCIDGRYKSASGLSPLAIPGADLGELGIIFAAANNFGLEINQEKVLAALLEVVGGAAGFHFHSDHHASAKIPGAGCGHWREMKSDPKNYHLEQEQIDFIGKNLLKLKKQGALEEILSGDHQEGAVLQVTGHYSVSPRFFLQNPEGRREVEVFVYQATLVDERHRAIASALIKKGAVKMLAGLDEEYLYHALSEETEIHLFETAKRLAKGLPIYAVNFDDKGDFEMKEMDNV